MMPTVAKPSTTPHLPLEMQVKKGANGGEATYLATIRAVDDGEKESLGEVAREIPDVLEEYKDVMLLELPKKLPPRREVDHQIELEHGAKPPAKASY